MLTGMSINIKMQLWLTMVLMCLSAITAKAANTITIGDITTTPGEESIVELRLNNSYPIAALQLDIPMSSDADFSIVENSLTIGSHASDHKASVGIHGNTLTVMLYSLSLNPIPAGEGTILSFKVKTGEKAFSLTLTPNVLATDTEGNEVACECKSFSFSNLSAKAVLNTEKIDFGRVPIRSSYTRSISVGNAGTAPLQINGVKLSSGYLSVSSRLPVSVNPGGTAIIDICYSPEIRGKVSETAILESNSSSTRTLVEIEADPYAVNELLVSSVSANSGEEIAVPLTLKNMDPISGFSMEFDLQDTFEYVEDSFQLSSSRTINHQAIANKIGNKLVITCWSITDTPFKGSEGEIASMRLRPKSRNGISLTPASVVLAAVVNGKVMDVTSDIFGGYISVNAPDIRVSNSVSTGRTPITESVSTEITVMNYGSAPLIINRVVIDNENGYEADVDLVSRLPMEIKPLNMANLAIKCSGLYEGELKGVIQIYCNDPERELVNIQFDGVRYAPNFISGTSQSFSRKDESAWIDINLSNYDAVSGLQFDLIFDHSLFSPSDDWQFTSRAQSFSMQRREISADHSRYFVYSISNDEISPGEGALARIPLKFNNDIAEGDYQFTISDPVVSTTALTNKNSAIEPYHFNVNISDGSGIWLLSEEENLRIYPVDHGIIIEGLNENDEVRIYSVNGVLMKVEKGNSRVQNLDDGIYIVMAKGKRIKIKI